MTRAAQFQGRALSISQADTSLSHRNPEGGAGVPATAQLRPLHETMEAFAARVAVIRAARATLDVQYYIWHGDLSDALMLDELEAAASRCACCSTTMGL